MRRYVSLMKKGSEAGATLRDGAADLWRKGVAMAWRVPADSGDAGAQGAHPHMPVFQPCAWWCAVLSHRTAVYKTHSGLPVPPHVLAK